MSQTVQRQTNQMPAWLDVSWSRAFRRRRSLQRTFMPRSGDLRPSWTNSRPSRGMTSTRLHRSADNIPPARLACRRRRKKR